MTDLTALALNASQTVPLSELHGVVCGIAVCHAPNFDLATLVHLLGAEALSDEERVGEFVEVAMTGLLADDLSFEPLLPEEDAPLAQRAEALAEWCGGFVAGLAAALGEVQIPDESGEIVRDFIAISNLETSLDEAQDAERDLVELAEFAKVGALLMLAQIAAGDDT